MDPFRFKKILYFVLDSLKLGQRMLAFRVPNIYFLNATVTESINLKAKISES